MTQKPRNAAATATQPSRTRHAGYFSVFGSRIQAEAALIRFAGKMQGRLMDVFCPSCGYNLHGIPEIRCPECGFGFDRAAVEATAIAEFEKHFATYSGIVVRSTFGIAFSLPAVLHRFGIIGGAPALVLAGFVAAYLVKRRFGRSRADGLLDWPPGLPRIAVAVIALSMFLVAGQKIGSLLAAACLLDAAMVWAHGY